MRSVSCELVQGESGQSSEYSQDERIVRWKIKKFTGGSEKTLKTKVKLIISCVFLFIFSLDNPSN